MTAIAEQIFVGGCQVAFAATYTGQFIKYLRPAEVDVSEILQPQQTERDRAVQRICSGMNAIGGIARLVDWVIDQKWFVIAKAGGIALKIIGHIAGVFFYLKNSIDILDNLTEVEGFLGMPERMRQSYHPTIVSGIEVYRYSLYMDLFANVVLSFYSGVQVCVVFGGAVLITPATLNLILLAGCAALIGSMILRFGAHDGIERLDFIRSTAAPPVRRWTFWHE